MFEHLTPSVIDTKTKNKLANFKIYLSVLLAVVFVFIFALSIGQGPAGMAQEEKLAKLIATVSVDPSDKKVVLGAKDISVFDWVVDTEQNGMGLNKIKIYINGLYNPEILEDLTLYHNEEPLFANKQVDAQGNIYFELENYILPIGQNHFSLFLANTDNLSTTNVFRFSLLDAASLSLFYQEHKFMPQGQWPLQSGLVSAADSGQILAFSNSADQEFVITSDLPQRVASFTLAADSEMVDVNHIDISLTGPDVDGAQFVLISDKKLLGQTQVKDGHLSFDLARPIALSIKNLSNIELHAFGLPQGDYEFALDKVSGLGFYSGVEVGLRQAIKLSQARAEGFFPEFSAGKLNTKLINGSNELYDLQVIARGREELKIYKLTWLLEPQNVNLDKAEIKVNNEIYIADINISGNKIIVKANWAKPIIVKNIGTDIKLILQTSGVKDKASIKTYLLSDETELADQAQANILWAAEEKLYNGYKLPFLPLVPNVLSN